MYKTVIIRYTPSVASMSHKIEDMANQMLHEGYELVTMSCVRGKAILVFKRIILGTD